MDCKEIFFDLDGTLLNTGEGICSSVQISLSKMGKPLLDEQTVKKFVGPPLAESYEKYCGLIGAENNMAVSIYREHYASGEMYKAEPYDGITQVLEKLKKKYRLYVVTAKPTEYSKELIAHFDMTKYFEDIYGASLDKSMRTKEKIIEYAILKSGAQAPVMVGDTLFDIIGAFQNDIPSVAVLYGYGEPEGLKQSTAIYCAKTVVDLYRFFE